MAAAQFTWTFDAPTGTYKQHALSAKLWMAAVEQSIFMDYLVPLDGFGKKMGEQVTLPRIRRITEPTSGLLTEAERIPEDQVQLSTTTITVKEFGRAVPYTSLSMDLSKYDLLNPIQSELADQMKLVMDTRAATAYKTAKVKYIPTGVSSGAFDTDGTASTQATANYNVFHAEELSDYLYDDLYAKPWSGEDYIGIFRTLALRGIKRDPDWEEWHKYVDPSIKQTGEVGRIENIRHIRTNHNNALGKIGASSVLGEGVVFGADSVAMAETETPELRAGIPDDFGRSKAVAWYGVFEMGIIWDTSNAGEAKIIHVASS